MNSEDTSSLRKESKEESLPQSLDLAFDRVKNILDEQDDRLDSLDVRAATLFAVATSTIGLGLRISLSTQKIQLTELFTLVFGYLIFIFYGFITIISVISLWVRSHTTLRNPIDIRNHYWDRSQQQFKYEMLAHMEEAYSHYLKNE